MVRTQKQTSWSPRTVKRPETLTLVIGFPKCNHPYQRTHKFDEVISKCSVRVQKKIKWRPTTLTFKLGILKCNQFISASKSTYSQNLVKMSQSIHEL